MIYVDRDRVDAPASLTAPDGFGERELLRANAYYAAVPDKSYDFKAYKEEDVKQALELLFAGKCAYCESKYKAVIPMDVEHYRPKGCIDGDANHRGYWWLAATWSNLLPSCIDCNRSRYHDLLESEGDAVVYALAGKRGLFPIRGPVRAATATAPLDEEDPLLINPCERDPAQHLDWKISIVDGRKASVAVPRLVPGGVDPYAKESIAVCGLNRSGLVAARTILLEDLECQYQDLLKVITDLSFMPDQRRQQRLPEVQQTIQRFLDKRKPDQPYSACVKRFVDDKAARLLANIDKL